MFKTLVLTENIILIQYSRCFTFLNITISTTLKCHVSWRLNSASLYLLVIYVNGRLLCALLYRDVVEHGLPQSLILITSKQPLSLSYCFFSLFCYPLTHAHPVDYLLHLFPSLCPVSIKFYQPNYVP